MSKSIQSSGLVLLLLAVVSGCAEPSVQATSATNGDRPAIDKSKYILTEEPDGAVGIMMAREDSKDQDDIVLVGRIGGRKDPWIKDRAAFMLIDASLSVVADGAETEDGQVCLDDCCAAERADSTTLVKVVDEKGKPLAIDARELLDVKESDMVVIQGKVQRDDEGTFTIAASGVYVRR